MKPSASSPRAPKATFRTETTLPQVSTKPSSEARDRRVLRVLAMVHELHKAGYQRLRICPGIGGPGAWRCAISPVSNTRKEHGALFRDETRLVARHTEASDNEYFGWRDAKTDTARELAAKFIQRFPDIAREGIGEDWPYVGWYVQMLGLAEKGDVPVAYSDWYGELDPRRLPTTKSLFEGHPEQSHLPMPPGGEAEKRPT